MQDSQPVDIDSFMLREEHNGAFPSHVTEDSLGVNEMSIDIDTALEAVEGTFTTTQLLPVTLTVRTATSSWSFFYTTGHRNVSLQPKYVSTPRRI